MTGINNDGTGVYAPAPGPAPAPASGASLKVTVDWSLITQLMGQYQAALKAPGSVSDGVTDVNGAPDLPEGEALSGDDIALALMSLNSQMLQLVITPLQARLESQKVKQQQLTDSSVKNAMDQLQKAIEARAKSKTSSIFGWISKIVSFVTTVVAIPLIARVGASGYVAAPLIIAGLMAAMLNPEDGGFEEADLSLSALAARGAAMMYEACGMDPAQAKQAAAFTSGVVGYYSCAILADPNFAGQTGHASATVAGASQQDAEIAALACTMVAMVVSAVVMAMLGRPPGGDAVAAADSAQKAAALAKLMATIAQGSVTIAKACNDMELAGLNRALGRLGADADRLSAAIARVVQLMEENQDLIKWVIESAQAKTEIASDILKSSQVVQSHSANAI